MRRERTTLIAGAGTIAKFRSTFGSFGPRRPSPTRWPVHTTFNMGRPTGRSRMSEPGTGSQHLTRTVRSQAARRADATVARRGCGGRGESVFLPHLRVTRGSSFGLRTGGSPVRSSDRAGAAFSAFGPGSHPGPKDPEGHSNAFGRRDPERLRTQGAQVPIPGGFSLEKTRRLSSEGRDQEFESGVSARAVERRLLLVTPRPASQPSQARSAPHPEWNTRADESCQACEQKAGVDQPGGPATDGRRGPPVPGNRSTQLEGIRETRSIWTQRDKRCRMRPCPSGGSAGLETPCVPACTG